MTVDTGRGRTRQLVGEATEIDTKALPIFTRWCA